MQRNANKKRMKATATLFLLLGAAFITAAPASAGLDLSGWAAGEATSAAGAALGQGAGTQDQGARADHDVAGAASTAAEAAAQAQMTPPDPSPVVESAAAVAESARAEATAHVNSALAKRDRLAAGGAADWGLYGDMNSGYDVVLGGSYAGGSKGDLALASQKGVRQHVDLKGHTQAVGGAKAKASGVLDMILGTVEGLYGKLGAKADLGLDGAAQALGNVGVEIAGIFGLQKSAELVNTDQLSMSKSVDVKPPALALARPDLPDPQLPSLAVNQGGSVAADAATVAQGAIQG